MNEVIAGVFSQEQALQLVEDVIGFPRPQKKYLLWYFEMHDGGYVPRVNFYAPAQELRHRQLIQKMSIALHLKRHGCARQVVIVEIHGVIQKHVLQNNQERSIAC